MPRRGTLQFSPTDEEREMLELRAMSEGLSLSAYLCRLIRHDWFHVHDIRTTLDVRRLYAELGETPPQRARIRTANGRTRKVTR